MSADRKPSTQPGQGIEDSLPVEILLGGRGIASGSAEYYLYDAMRNDGYQITLRPDPTKGMTKFFVASKDSVEVIALAQKTKKRPGFEMLSFALTDGNYLTINEMALFGETDSKLLAEINLIVAARNHEKSQFSPSVFEKASAWSEYLKRKSYAKKGFGIKNVDALNHVIGLVQKEYKAAKEVESENTPLKGLDSDITLGC